jgi:hypothetical protein
MLSEMIEILWHFFTACESKPWFSHSTQKPPPGLIWLFRAKQDGDLTLKDYKKCQHCGLTRSNRKAPQGQDPQSREKEQLEQNKDALYLRWSELGKPNFLWLGGISVPLMSGSFLNRADELASSWTVGSWMSAHSTLEQVPR